MRPRIMPLLMVLTLALPIQACGPTAQETVNAADYDAFWLWAGVAP